MDGATVALAAIALATTTVGCLIWVIKYLANTLARDIKEHTKAAMGQIQASKDLQRTVKQVGEQAELTSKNSMEQLTFMKALNGKLSKATIQTVQEQHIEHQHVQNEIIKESK